jgi:cardiolipin synthase
LLLGAAFITLTWTRDLTVAIPMWLTVTTLSRDVLLVISVLVVNLVVDRRIFFPSFLGKMSTVSQVVTVGLVLLLNALEHTVTWMTYVFHFTLLMTVASALHYVYLASTKNAGKGLVSESLPQ